MFFRVRMYLSKDMQANVAVEYMVLLLCIQEVLGSDSTWKLTIVTESFQGFSYSLQETARIASQIKPPPLLSTSFPIHY
jgi:hypothetical protein